MGSHLPSEKGVCTGLGLMGYQIFYGMGLGSLALGVWL